MKKIDPWLLLLFFWLGSIPLFGQDTLTYTITAYNQVTTSREIPGVTAVLTGSYGAGRIPGGYTPLLTVSNYPYELSQVILRMNTNAKSGAGTITIKADTIGKSKQVLFCSGTYQDLCGPQSDKATDYALNGTIGLTGRVNIQIVCTESSLYLYQYTLIGKKITNIPPPLFSISSGTYSTTQELSITHPDKLEIHYTTDGTLPTLESMRYTAPLILTTGTHQFCAVAFDSEGNAGREQRETIIIDDKPALSLTQNSIDFGELNVVDGSASATVNLPWSIKNLSAPLTFTIEGDAFSCPFTTMTPQELSSSLPLIFTCTEVGFYTGELLISGGGLSQSYKVSLTGHAIEKEGYLGSGTFTKISSMDALTDGYYLLYGKGTGYALNATNNGSFFDVTSTSSSAPSSVTDPPVPIVWKVEKQSDNTYMISNDQGYITYKGSSTICGYKNDYSDSCKWIIRYQNSQFEWTNLAVQTRVFAKPKTQFKFNCPTKYDAENLGVIFYKLKEAVARPIISGSIGIIFTDSQEITLSCTTPDAELYYTTDNSRPTINAIRYTSPFSIYGSTKIRAVAVLAGTTPQSSYITSVSFTRATPIILQNDQKYVIAARDGEKWMAMAVQQDRIGTEQIALTDENEANIQAVSPIWTLQASQNGYQIISSKGQQLALSAEAAQSPQSRKDRPIAIESPRKSTTAGENNTWQIQTNDNGTISLSSGDSYCAFHQGYQTWELTHETTGYINQLLFLPIKQALLGSSTHPIAIGSHTAETLQAILSDASVCTLNLRYASLPPALQLTPGANANCLLLAEQNYGWHDNVVIQGICEQLNLSDKIPFNTDHSFWVQEAHYTREAYLDGGWETLMLPYDVPANRLPADFLFEEFAELTTTQVTFRQVHELHANTPYIMKYTGTPSEGAQGTCRFSISQDSIRTPIMPLTFVGTYQLISGEGKYLLRPDGKAFGMGTDTSFVPPFRAYLEPTYLFKNAPVKVFHQNQNLLSTKGIQSDELQIYVTDHQLHLCSPTTCCVSIYQLNGVLFDLLQLEANIPLQLQLPRGLYLIDRRLVPVY